MWIPRDVEPRLRRSVKTRPVVVLTGGGYALSDKASAMSKALRGVDHSPYEVDFWSLPYWYREG